MNVQSRPRQDSSRMTIDAFFDWVEGQERKYELVEGVPRMLPWVKRNHDRITANLISHLHDALIDSGYEVATGDYAVKTGPDSIRYADVMVDVAGADGSGRTTEDAVVLIEVLSDSTMHTDFGAKLQEYQGLESLKTYLILSQDEKYAWLWERDEDGDWPENPKRIDEAEGSVDLNPIGVTLAFAQIYLNVN